MTEQSGKRTIERIAHRQRFHASTTSTFEDVLFTDETETPVNVLTGETPAHSQATVEEATGFAASIDTNTPQIALPASVETQIETQSKPYTAAAFFHFKATGSLELHRAYHAAYNSDAFSVDSMRTTSPAT